MLGSGVIQLERRGPIYSFLIIGKSSFETWNLAVQRVFGWELTNTQTLIIDTVVLKGYTCLHQSPEEEQENIKHTSVK